MTVRRERIEYIDLAKGICILLVMILHLIPATTEYSDQIGLECLRMPLYFCLSGLFFKDYGGIKNFFLKKTNNILIPFLAWYLISYFIFYLGAYTVMNELEMKHHFSDIIQGNPIYNGPIWFLICLFWSNIIFFIINKISQRWIWQFIMVVLCASIGFLLAQRDFSNYLYIGTCLSSMPFFFMGFTLKKTLLNLPADMSKKEYGILAVSMLGFLLIAFFPNARMHYMFVENKYISDGSLILTYLASIFIVIAVLLLSKRIKRVLYLSYLGRYSIIVLVSHLLLGSFLTKMIDKTGLLDSHDNIRDLCVFFIVFLSMSLVIPFCKNFLPYVTAQKELITKERLRRIYKFSAKPD